MTPDELADLIESGRAGVEVFAIDVETLAALNAMIVAALRAWPHKDAEKPTE